MLFRGNTELFIADFFVQRTATKAVVLMECGQPLGDGFQLLIGLAEIHVPRMWVERHVSKPDSQVSDKRSKYERAIKQESMFLCLFSCNFANI